MTRLCWRLSRLPELEHLSRGQRHALLKMIALKRVYFKLVTSSIVYGSIVTAVVALVARQAAAIPLLAVAMVGVFSVLISYQVQMAYIRITLRAQLVDGLRGKRLPVCLRCGYDLGHATTDRCPECNARIRVPRE